MRRDSPEAQYLTSVSPTIDAIRQYQSRAHEDLHCDLTRCPRCHRERKSDAFFSLHMVRERRLRVIVGRFVHEFTVTLVRWRCPNCRLTFTCYPPFMLPHKQYALPELGARAQRYVEDGSVSYREGVRESKLPIFHDASIAGPGASELEKESEVAPTLAHTTLFRWVTTLGAVTPSSSMGQEQRIDCSKFRSQARKRRLTACLKFCRARL